MTSPVVKQSTVVSSDGTRIAVYESGNPSGPVLVAVHGYPDNHSTWDGVAAELGDRYRVITYDVRGAGASGKPMKVASYRIEQLTEDFRAVIDAVSPDAPVHLLAHDWGSIQSWGPVTDPTFRGRISTFTSISGPSLDYAGVWMRDRSHLGASARQLIHSYYTVLFQIPKLPERVVSLPRVEEAIARIEREGRGEDDTSAPLVRRTSDLTNGINLYRANFRRRLLRPEPRRTFVPTQVLVPVDDPYVTAPLASGSPVPFVDDLRVIEIPGSHWIGTARPDLVAMHVHGFIEEKAPTAVRTSAAEPTG